MDFNDPCWRFEERVKKLMNGHGFTREEAEEVVKFVILEKEQHGTQGSPYTSDLSILSRPSVP